MELHEVQEAINAKLLESLGKIWEGSEERSRATAEAFLGGRMVFVISRNDVAVWPLDRLVLMTEEQAAAMDAAAKAEDQDPPGFYL